MCEDPNAHPFPNNNLGDLDNCFGYFLPIVEENVNDETQIHAVPIEQDKQELVETTTNQNQRIDKSHWVCDYSDDIFETLRETELKRRLICFRSQQCGYHRPILLHLLKSATEKHNLARTTLHLAIYLLDCFMDNYTIRVDKLYLTAITCLIVAAKIEEADMNMPKFADLNKLVGDTYLLLEFKNVEFKVLGTFNFDLIRPTVATFAEYFAHSFVTLEDYDEYVRNWHKDYGFQKSTIIYPGQQQTMLPLYVNYEEMLSDLNKTLFEFVDVSISYMKFANARPSIIASACIAAVRQVQHVLPIWTPYLIKLTQCTDLVIVPFIDALIALYGMHVNKEITQTNSSLSQSHITSNSVLCDSPDSGIVSADAKSESSGDEDDFDGEYLDNTEVEDESYHCLEYPLMPKRRRLF